MADAIIFWVAAIVALAAAVRVITLRNPVTSVLHLIVTLGALAVLFLQLSAEFIAMLQIIIYAGAIMVLFLFVIMLLNLRRDEFGPSQLRGIRFLGALVGAAFLGELIVIFSGADAAVGTVPPGFGGVEAVGRELFGGYLLAFELTALLLLAAALAVVVLARTRTARESEGN